MRVIIGGGSPVNGGSKEFNSKVKDVTIKKLWVGLIIMLLDSHDIYVMHIILHILYERVQIKLHLCVSSSYFKLTVQIRFKSYSMLGTNTSDKKFDFLFFILMYVIF